jgi:hypothetical protein
VKILTDAEVIDIIIGSVRGDLPLIAWAARVADAAWLATHTSTAVEAELAARIREESLPKEVTQAVDDLVQKECAQDLPGVVRYTHCVILEASLYTWKAIKLILRKGGGV